MRQESKKNKTAHPSKMVAFLVLMLALSLPFILVKHFRDRDRPNHLPQKISHHPYQVSADDEGTSNEVVESLVEEDISSPETKTELEEEAIIVSENPAKKPTDESKNEPTYETPKISTSNKKENKWEVIYTKEGDTLASLFKSLSLDDKALASILKDNPHAERLSKLKPGQKLQFAIQEQTLNKLIIPLTPTQSITITRKDETYKTQITPKDVTSHNHYVTATVKNSLYATAKQRGIPYKLIHQMAHIFNWEIDFSKDVREGDRFTIVYKAFFIENKQVGTGEILAATYTTKRGKTFQAIRHAKSDGKVDYYNEKGESLRKAFSRYPVKFSHISSAFSLNRMHPILKVRRPPEGVDLAAPIGTPIKAIGDGRITSIGFHNGYGNMIKIKHNDTYTTLYAHMLRFKKGLSKGSRVKKGQVIGYVGQTGLADGPHCHFEFHINKHPKNPTTVDLPRALPVPKGELATFQYNAGALLAHIKLFEEAHQATEERGLA